LSNSDHLVQTANLPRLLLADDNDAEKIWDNSVSVDL